jgi:hypothetical protein
VRRAVPCEYDGPVRGAWWSAWIFLGAACAARGNDREGARSPPVLEVRVAEVRDAGVVELPIDAESVRLAVVDLLRAEGTYPEGRKLVVDLVAGGVSEVRMGSRRVAVAPVRVGLADDSAADCRIAVARTDPLRAELLPAPFAGMCEAMNRVAEIDLNDDGVPDLVFEVVVPSDQPAAVASEAEVYLSDVDGATYCFSRLASAAVPPGADGPAIRVAVTRRAAPFGAEALRCAGNRAE